MELNGLDYECILSTMHGHGVQSVLIGGLNYFLRFRPVTTMDVDLFLDDSWDNRRLCEAALETLGAEWGTTEDDWGPTSRRESPWLGQQSVYCLLTRSGPLDLFFVLPGVDSFQGALARAERCVTRLGTPFHSLSAADMLACQLALPDHLRRRDRVVHLQELLST